MDPREASAMTEASGLADDRAGREKTRPASPDSQHPLSRISDRLRRITLAAPLPSLFVAFLAGIMVARRR
jgi:hypothetical protein